MPVINPAIIKVGMESKILFLNEMVKNRLYNLPNRVKKTAKIDRDIIVAIKSTSVNGGLR